MKSYLYLLIFFLAGCEISGQQNAAVEPFILDQLREEILTLASSQNCINAEEWNFTPMGHKPCGGPASYIAYSRKIDVDRFLELVKSYTELQAEYNKQNNLVSDCALTPRPTGVVCENSKPVLTY